MIRHHIVKGVLFYALLGFSLVIAYGPPSFATEVDHNTSDDGSTQFTLPFNFELYGVSFDTAKMYTNGVVQFGAPPPYGHYCCHGEEYGSTTDWYQNSYNISYSIMPLWTDIYANNSNSRQYTEGTATSFTFGWENIREYNRQSTNTFALTIDDTGSWYVEYDAVDILNHHVSVGSVGDYDAEEWDQFTYRTYQQNTTLSDVNGYTGYSAVEQEEQQTIVQQFTSDGICDYTAIEDPDCTSATESYEEETYGSSGGSVDGSIIDDGQDDGSTTDTYSDTTVVASYQDLTDVYEDQFGSSQNQSTDDTTAPDGQDSGDTYGDTGENEEIVMEEEIYYEEPSSTGAQDGSVSDTTPEQDNQTNGEVVTAETTGQVPVGTSSDDVIAGDIVSSPSAIEIDPNAALNADSAFVTKQRIGSFRRSVNSRAVAHLVSVGGLPTIGATSAEQYQAMTNSGSTVNGMLVNQEMANDPSRMYAPANPSNPTGTGMMIADASQSQMNNNTFDPNQTGMYGVHNGNVDNQALQGMIVATESPMGNEIELEEALSTDDLGGLSINDFRQPKLADQSNWYSNENALAQQSIYNNQEFYKQQEIYKGVNWYGNN